MLPNEAKQVIENIRSIVESDGLNVPAAYLNEGIKSLVYNLPIDASIQKCIESAKNIHNKHQIPDSPLNLNETLSDIPENPDDENDENEIKKPLKNNGLALYVPRQLKIYDAALSFFRLLELEQVPLPATFDPDHLKSLHRIIMSDIFEDSGEFRRHNSRLRGNDFLPPSVIAGRVASLFGLMRKEKFEELTKNEIAMRISYFMHELYIIHPFSTGNGRVSRIFFRQFADSIGYRLNYSKIEGITLRGAEILAFQTDNIQPLYLLINKCLSPI